MTKRLFCLVALVGLMLTTWAVVTLAQRPGAVPQARKPAARDKTQHPAKNGAALKQTTRAQARKAVTQALTAQTAQVENAPRVDTNDYALKVDHKLGLLNHQEQLHRQVRDVLNAARIGVPDDRVRYFRDVVPLPNHQVQGWTGAIAAVEPIQNGVAVELEVRAEYGDLHDTATLMERYAIVDGEVHYVGSWVPRNFVRGVFGG